MNAAPPSTPASGPATLAAAPWNCAGTPTGTTPVPDALAVPVCVVAPVWVMPAAM